MSPLRVLTAALFITASFSKVPETCPAISDAGIDYADANLTVVNGTNDPGTCCDACTNYNIKADAEGRPRCNTAVWHNIEPVGQCSLKNTADKPFKGGNVQAYKAPAYRGSLYFSRIYTSNMVLQSAPAQANVWGFCFPFICPNSSSLSAKFDGNAIDVRVISASNGVNRWVATLPATPASTDEHSIVVTSGVRKDASATIDGVLFGDVWVCSGQSNMAYSINGSNGEKLVHPPVNNSLAEIADMKNYPYLRLFRVGRNQQPAPVLEPLPASDGGSDALVTGWSRPCPPNGTEGTSPCRVDFSNVCYFFGRNIQAGLKIAQKKTVPIGLIGTYVGGTADELWSSPDALKKCLDPSKPIPATDSTLWNGMISPLLNMTIKGAIWYQGEADSGHPGGEYDGYNCTFPEMIADWRRQWHSSTGGQTDKEFPFGFVQLNSVGNGTAYDNPQNPQDNADDLGSEFGFAGLRWSQSASYGYAPNPAQPSVFMGVSVDTPDKPFTYTGNNGVRDPGFNVHSPFKQPTAARLARAAMPVAYPGVMDVDTTGPRAGQVTRDVSAGTVVIKVANLGSAKVLEARSTRGFEALSNGTWVSVVVSGTDQDSVTVSGVPSDATKLRYNWYSNPCGTDCFDCAVYIGPVPLLFGGLSGEMGFLPLPPFVVHLEP